MLRSKSTLIAFALAATVAIAILTRIASASDHQDTPEVEFSQRMDINDVYAFPGATPDRLAIVLTTASPVTPAQANAGLSFDPNLLYQIKIDNDGDAIEDLVFQVMFEGTGASQTVRVRGPVIPNELGTANSLVANGPLVTGPVEQVIGNPNGMQVFAGLSDDPFFLDLEQFFRILPDRKPAGGALSQLPETPTASAWRDPGIDYFAGLNALTIAIELPESMLTTGGSSTLGLWATISR
jgi:hypothetical protein